MARAAASAAVMAAMALLLIAGTAMGARMSAARTLLQGGGSVPQECTDAGLALQSGCSAEIEKALQTLGVKADASDTSQLAAAAKQAQASGKIDQALNEVSPSAGCCKAACTFTSQLCACNQDVVNVVQGIIPLDSGTVGRLFSTIAGKCNFKALSLATGSCPAASSPKPAFACPA